MEPGQLSGWELIQTMDDGAYSVVFGFGDFELLISHAQAINVCRL